MNEFEQFKRICDEYEGKLIEEENKLSFIANNKIASYYQDGSIHTEKVVECRLRLRSHCCSDGSERLLFDGEEETYSIKGGFGSSFSEDALRYNLEYYGFKRKSNRQLSLFD